MVQYVNDMTCEDASTTETMVLEDNELEMSDITGEAHTVLQNLTTPWQCLKPVNTIDY